MDVSLGMEISRFYHNPQRGDFTHQISLKSPPQVCQENKIRFSLFTCFKKDDSQGKRLSNGNNLLCEWRTTSGTRLIEVCSLSSQDQSYLEQTVHETGINTQLASGSSVIYLTQPRLCVTVVCPALRLACNKGRHAAGQQHVIPLLLFILSAWKLPTTSFFKRHTFGFMHVLYNPFSWVQARLLTIWSSTNISEEFWNTKG